jgi:hypothetical protein
MGAQAGASTYQNALGSAYSTGAGLASSLAGTQAGLAASAYGTAAGQNVGLANTGASIYGTQAGQQAQIYGTEAGQNAALANTAANIYGTQAGQQASMYGTQAGENVGLTTTQNQYDVGMAETQAQIQAAQYAAGGAAASGAAALLPSIISAFTGKAAGTDNLSGGIGVVGEHGPEVVQLPQGAKVIPNIKDGYDMLNYITRSVRGGRVNPPPQMDPTNKEVSNTAMIAAMNDKLEKVAAYIKKAGK